jgi:hypothetical protein
MSPQITHREVKMPSKDLFQGNGAKLNPGVISGAYWKKSSQSMGNGNCVEVAPLGRGHVGVRDSKDKTGPVLQFTPDEWSAFIGGVRNGEFDSL